MKAQEIISKLSKKVNIGQKNLLNIFNKICVKNTEDLGSSKIWVFNTFP